VPGFPFFCDLRSEGQSKAAEAPVEGEENLLDVYVRRASGEVVVILEVEEAVAAGIFEIGEAIFAAERQIVGEFVFGTGADRSRSDRPPRTDLPSAALSPFEKEGPAANPITFKKDVLALCSAIVPLAEGNAKLLPPDAPGTLIGDSCHSAAQ
jgi:hypothetical protein